MKESNSEQLWREYNKFKKANSKKKLTMQDFNEEYQKQRRVVFDGTIGENMDSVFDAICEIKIGEIIVAEFLEIKEAREATKDLSLAEALSLFISLIWKNNYAYTWRSSPYFLGLFYEEIVLKLYQDSIKDGLNASVMAFLTKESNFKGGVDNDGKTHFASIGKGFPVLMGNLKKISSCFHGIRGFSNVNNPVPHYLSVRLMEQALDFVKNWFDEELADRDSAFSLQIMEVRDRSNIERKRNLMIESAALLSEQIESFFQSEQILYWGGQAEVYSAVWEEVHCPQVQTWDRQFNVFKKYHLGHILEKDEDLEYYHDIYGGSEEFDEYGYHKDLPAGTKETLRAGTLITPKILEKLVDSNTVWQNPKDEETGVLFGWKSKQQPSINTSDTLQEFASVIERMIGKDFAKKDPDNELGAVLSLITTGSVMEYLRLVREDSKLNRVNPGLGGDERGRPRGKDDERGMYFSLENMPGAGYLSDIYNGVKNNIWRKEAKSSEESGVKIEEWSEESGYSSASVSSSPSIDSLPTDSDDESSVGSGVSNRGSREVKGGAWSWSMLFGSILSSSGKTSNARSEEPDGNASPTFSAEDLQRAVGTMSFQKIPTTPPARRLEESPEMREADQEEEVQLAPRIQGMERREGQPQIPMLSHRTGGVLNLSEEPSLSLKEDQKESKRLEALKLVLSILRVFGILQMLGMLKKKSSERWSSNVRPQVHFRVRDKLLMGMFCLLLGGALVYCIKRKGLLEEMGTSQVGDGINTLIEVTGRIYNGIFQNTKGSNILGS